MYQTLHIHGDNIVECERALDLIACAFQSDIVNITGPMSSVACPSFLIQIKGIKSPLTVTFFPGFGRWDHDIHDSIRERGGRLREAADVIVTGISESTECPLFAIEFCGALPAGNQAWQRSGRAFSFGASRIPYLYISELGGYELDSNRNRKASRMPNPAVPFSYLSYSIEKDTPVFPILVASPGADIESRKHFAREFADVELTELVRALLLNEAKETIFQRLQMKVLSFIKKRGDDSRKGGTLSGTQWEAAYNEIINKNSFSQFLIDHIQQPWSKTAYIDALTDRAKMLMDLGNKYGIGISSTSLPMCLIEKNKRNLFANEVSKLYNSLGADFLSWLTRDEHLAICWIMGFKPKGDDARPDRGLPPLTRMLVGCNHDMMTIVYGPAPVATWSELNNEPCALAMKNGLWEAILETSDALLVESATDQDVSEKGYVRKHWETERLDIQHSNFFVSPRPVRFGENDVDTALHLLLCKFTNNDVFESMCNPPGGDWSGISICNTNTEIEYRWISLPRVSGQNTKRPDHVFQISNLYDLPIILSIESKEHSMSVEQSIGHRLNGYLTQLFDSNANIERPFGTIQWKHSKHKINVNDYCLASAAAFIKSDSQHTQKAIDSAEVDLIFIVEFINHGVNSIVKIWPRTKTGNSIAAYLKKLVIPNEYISIDIHSQ